MKRAFKHTSGSITAEYAIALIMLMIPMWYVLMGGSGLWIDTNRPVNSGNLSDPSASPAPTPGLLQVLDQRQHDFSDELNQP